MESPQQAGAGIVSSPSFVPATPLVQPVTPTLTPINATPFKLSGSLREELDLVHLPQRLSHEATMLSFSGLFLLNALILPWAFGASNFLIGVFAWLAVSVVFGFVSGSVASRLYGAKPFAAGLAGLYSLQAALATFLVTGAVIALVASQTVFSSVPALSLVFWLFVFSAPLFVGLKVFAWFESHAVPSVALTRVAGAWLAGFAAAAILIAALGGVAFG
ncbi:hypothetical protein AUJ14_05850 [Candidatus Micrarchaeota archaeon CG1_02_55_22]|nr:MAG: hypothetical protein AUJ14_05850 [Candidatus Micrarchaeota archaeon CG1_02_55_22]